MHKRNKEKIWKYTISGKQKVYWCDFENSKRKSFPAQNAIDFLQFLHHFVETKRNVDKMFSYAYIEKRFRFYCTMSIWENKTLKLFDYTPSNNMANTINHVNLITIIIFCCMAHAFVHLCYLNPCMDLRMEHGRYRMSNEIMFRLLVNLVHFIFENYSSQSNDPCRGVFNVHRVQYNSI